MFLMGEAHDKCFVGTLSFNLHSKAIKGAQQIKALAEQTW